MSHDKFLKDQMEQLGNQTMDLGKSAGNALDAVFAKFKELLSEEDYEKWKDLNGRLLTARLNGNFKQAKSIEEDIKELFGNEPEQ